MIRKKSLRRTELNPELKNIAKEAKISDVRSKQTAVSLKLADVYQRMEETRAEQKDFSVHLPNSLISQYGDELLGTTSKQDMQKDATLSWNEELKQDPYVGEAINIIADMK
jgi:C-terminal domain of tail specific protease (DUF3340)